MLFVYLLGQTGQQLIAWKKFHLNHLPDLGWQKAQRLIFLSVCTLVYIHFPRFSVSHFHKVQRHIFLLKCLQLYEVNPLKSKCTCFSLRHGAFFKKINKAVYLL